MYIVALDPVRLNRVKELVFGCFRLGLGGIMPKRLYKTC